MFGKEMNSRPPRKLIKGLFFVFAMITFVLVLGLVVMFLWNNIIALVFGWPALTFWQAVGLLILCRILIGGPGWHKRHGWSKHSATSWRHKWRNMSAEEKLTFKEKWKDRCK